MIDTDVKIIADSVLEEMNKLHTHLLKTCAGSKAASQRARVSSVRLGKLMKLFRDVSMREMGRKWKKNED